jgi:predicted helicase
VAPDLLQQPQRTVGDPRYILDLVARIITVSLQTMRVVDALPRLFVREAE